MSSRASVLGIALGVGLAAASSVAHAAEADAELQWNPGWARFGALDWALTGGALATALGAELVGPDRRDPYTERNAFDEGVRDALRAETRSGRKLARFGSDALWGLAAPAPVAIDAVANAWLYRNSPDVAWELAWLDVEAASIAFAMTGIAKSLASRERPYGRNCGASPQSEDCVERDRYYSFFSGHSSGTFSAATVACVSAYYVPMWGTSYPYWRCLAGYGLAASVATLRVVADRHYASDIAVGAVVGTGVGFLVPWLHFRGGAPTRARRNDGTFVTLVPSLTGVSVSGAF